MLGYCFQCVCLCDVVLETPIVAGTTTDLLYNKFFVVLSTLPGVYMSVFLWPDFVNVIASQS